MRLPEAGIYFMEDHSRQGWGGPSPGRNRRERYFREWYSHDPDYRIILSNEHIGVLLYHLLPGRHQRRGRSLRRALYYSSSFEQVRWWATINFLLMAVNYKYPDDKELHQFFNQSLEQRSWEPLKIAGDYLEERGDPRAKRLRNFFPWEKHHFA